MEGKAGYDIRGDGPPGLTSGYGEPARAAAVRDSRRLARLRRRARRLYALGEVEWTVGPAGRRYRVALPADPDAPLDELAAQGARGMPGTRRLGMRGSVSRSGGDGRRRDNGRNTGTAALRAAAEDAQRTLAGGEHMPYWALLWPSGLALAEELESSPPNPLASAEARGDERGRRRALELGCGLGVTATAALEAGLALWAVDCFPEAVAFCRYNTLRNAGRTPRTAVLDWRTAAGQAACLALGPFDVVLAADVLYEERDVAPLLELAPRVVAPGGTFWLAEPGRRVARLFVEAARARGWRDEERVHERAWPPDGDVVRVAVHRFTGLT